MVPRRRRLVPRPRREAIVTRIAAPAVEAHGPARIAVVGARPAGLSVTGWAKRGPSGVIGTNRADAAQTVKSLLADFPGLAPPKHNDRDALELLEHRGAKIVDWVGWLRLESMKSKQVGDEEVPGSRPQIRPTRSITFDRGRLKPRRMRGRREHCGELSVSNLYVGTRQHGRHRNLGAQRCPRRS